LKNIAVRLGKKIIQGKIGPLITGGNKKIRKYKGGGRKRKTHLSTLYGKGVDAKNEHEKSEIVR